MIQNGANFYLWNPIFTNSTSFLLRLLKSENDNDKIFHQLYHLGSSDRLIDLNTYRQKRANGQLIVN